VVHSLQRVKRPGDEGYEAYWRERSESDGLNSVMWGNEDYNRLADAYQKQLLDEALAEIGTGRVLDLCCGTGRLSVHLGKQGHRVVGLDLACMVEVARERNAHPNVTYAPSQEESVDVPEGPFDAIVAVGALPCVCETVEKFETVLADIHCHIRAGGLFIAMEPFHAMPLIRRPLHLSPAGARRRIQAAGFRLLSTRPLFFLPFSAILARAWSPAPSGFTRRLFRLGERLLRVPGLGALSDYKMYVFRREGA
jgi:2-polyprenyl-3-methyl-5-hydroxy-6-metoxy-1,4-benzoquinol methylase